MTRRRAALGGLLVIAVACVAAWALAYPSAALGAAVTRAVADGAAVVTVGLLAVPALEGPRYRPHLIRRATAPLIAASAVWVVAEIVRLVLAAADAAGTSPARLALQTTWEFAAVTAAGRAGLLTIAVAAVVCALTSWGARTGPPGVVVAGCAGIGIVGHALTGHLSESPLGGIAIAAHALAAAVWCGVLAGLVLTVDHRGQWARVLPVFSRLSLGCVAVLLVGGVSGSITMLGSPADLYATGYGRVLSAKIVLTCVLTVLAWHNREIWLPAARMHRSTAVVSRRRAYTELALMAAALAAAATLSITG